MFLPGSWERKDWERMSKGKETLQKKVKGWIFKFHTGKYSVLRKTDDFFIFPEDTKSFSDALK